MGILNTTPDSFSDGGKYTEIDVALRHVESMMANGADIIDIGGESTRPGAKKIGQQEEMDRVLPVLERIKKEKDVYVSVDTSRPELMTEAIKLGANMINDVRAFQREGAVSAVSGTEVDLCVMHMLGEPGTMQESPEYNDVVVQVSDFLKKRIEALVESGVKKENIIIDPGFGFGKTLKHNLILLNRLDSLKALGCEILVGLSRKSMIGKILDKEVDERIYGSLTLALLAMQNGAKILRVHDVEETKQVVDIAYSVLNEGNELK